MAGLQLIQGSAEGDAGQRRDHLDGAFGRTAVAEGGSDDSRAEAYGGQRAVLVYCYDIGIRGRPNNGGGHQMVEAGGKGQCLAHDQPVGGGAQGDGELFAEHGDQNSGDHIAVGIQSVDKGGALFALGGEYTGAVNDGYGVIVAGIGDGTFNHPAVGCVGGHQQNGVGRRGTGSPAGADSLQTQQIGFCLQKVGDGDLAIVVEVGGCRGSGGKGFAQNGGLDHQHVGDGHIAVAV